MSTMSGQKALREEPRGRRRYTAEFEREVVQMMLDGHAVGSNLREQSARIAARRMTRFDLPAGNARSHATNPRPLQHHFPTPRSAPSRDAQLARERKPG
jgi:hypothetical protein